MDATEVAMPDVTLSDEAKKAFVTAAAAAAGMVIGAAVIGGLVSVAQDKWTQRKIAKKLQETEEE